MSTESERAPGDAAEAGTSAIGYEATLSPGSSLEDGPAVRLGGQSDRERVGRYRVIATLGSGGMGRVYEAVDDRLDRSVAVKVLHQYLSEQHRGRLVREAQALARLSHPNVVHVYEIEADDDETFVVMELVRGRTLQEWSQQEPRPSWRACVEIYRQAGAGLAAAHAEGLVHRDFKPGNAIIDAKGRVRVLDFGLVRQAGEREPVAAASPAAAGVGDGVDPCLTTTGTVLGTPAYMAPEQMSGHDVDARSDQFSFCVALYEAVYGERPFRGNTLEALMVALGAGRIEPAPKRTAVPAKLRRALLRGLASAPEQRFTAMDALLAELERLLVPRTTRWLALGLVGALAAVGLGVGYYASQTGFGVEGAQAGAEAEGLIDPNAQAKLLYEEGQLAYRRGSFGEAVQKWEKSFELSERSLLLYDISLALEMRYESSGDVDDLLKARSVLERFLTIAEANPHVAEGDAKERIADLDARIAELEANPRPRRRTAEP